MSVSKLNRCQCCHFDNSLSSSHPSIKQVYHQ